MALAPYRKYLGFMRSRLGHSRELVLIIAGAVAIISAAFWVTFQFVKPAPPDSVTIATGSTNGGYFAIGSQYARILRQSGINMEVRPTAGSIENIKLVSNPNSGVQLALLQGGIANHQSHPEIISLGRIFLEPLWVFYKTPETIDRLTAMRGKRIAIGGPGSGTQKLASDLLIANAVDNSNSTLLPIGGTTAIEALRRGEADVAFLVMSPEAPLIKQLIREPGIKLMSFTQAEAFKRRFPFLFKISLPQGVIDLVNNIPDEDITLLAASAALVANQNLHPTLISLLTEAAKTVHKPGGLFQSIGEFPQMIDPEFPVAEDAERAFHSGPPFLQRYLPFWLASFLERSFILLLPIISVLLPALRGIPWLYNQRIRKRILFWYSELKSLEQKMNYEVSSGFFCKYYLREIERIDFEVSQIPVPLGYSDQLFNLRRAVFLVRHRYEAQIQTENPKYSDNISSLAS